MEKLRVAIVGCGRISVMYAIAFKGLADEIEVVAACDKDQEKAKAFAVQFGCPAVADIAEVLALKPDAVHLCTPHYLHAPQAIQAMRAGVNVLTEKPMATTLADADDMIRTARETGWALGVIFQSRYEAGVREMKMLIEDGRLGAIQGAWSTMNWSRPPAYYNSDWKGRKAMEGGGVLIDQTIHTIDMVQWLVGSRVKSVLGSADTRVLTMTEVEDVASAVIEFQNGCRYSLFACNYNSYNAPIEFEITGEKGRLKLVGDRAFITIEGQEPYEVAPAPSDDYAGKDYWGNFHKLQLADYYKSLRAKQTPIIDGREGRNALEIVLAVYESSASGKTVELG